MQSLIDWMRATAEWMRADRPDLFETNAHALNALEEMMEDVRSNPIFRKGVETGGYLLTHNEEDGVEDWTIFKSISTCVLFQPENEVSAYHWLENSGIVKTHPDLPALEDLPDLPLDD